MYSWVHWSRWYGVSFFASTSGTGSRHWYVLFANPSRERLTCLHKGYPPFSNALLELE